MYFFFFKNLLLGPRELTISSCSYCISFYSNNDVVQNEGINFYIFLIFLGKHGVVNWLAIQV